MRRPSDCDWLGTCWLGGGLLLAALCFWNAFPHPGLSGTTSSDSTISRLSNGHTTIPIEHIRVGDRVVTELPKEAKDADRSQSLADRQTVDPHTWCLVRMRAESVWDDGTVDDINVETLQPPQWLAYHHVEVGASVPIPLDLVEMGLPETLTAKVLGIDRCPPIKDGPGRIVLTTVNHLNNYVFDLTIEDKFGHTETIGVTGFHKFYSHTRQAWLSAEQLWIDEELNGLKGRIRVAALDRRPNTHRVYNITVERDFIYRIAHSGILVHNVGCKNVHSGQIDEDRALDAAIELLGPNYREIRNTGVFRNGEDTLQIDFTDADLGHPQPHINILAVAPDGRTFLENGHLYLNPPTHAPTPSGITPSAPTNPLLPPTP